MGVIFSAVTGSPLSRYLSVQKHTGQGKGSLPLDGLNDRAKMPPSEQNKRRKQTVRNKIDMSLSPQETFLNPWQDGCFALLADPAYFWRTVEPAIIEGFAASAHDQINARITSTINGIRRTRQLDNAFVFETVPAVLQSASFRKSVVLAGERLLLSGAAGTRAVNRYRRENRKKGGATVEDDMAAYFKRCRIENSERPLPLWPDDIGADTPFVIECRNTFNFYHFVTESLCQLTLLDGMDFQGDIYFHYPNREEKHRPFIKTFVEALFPELEGRVFYERTPKEYDRVVSGYDLLSTYPFAPDDLFAELNRLAGNKKLDHGANSVIANWRIIAANGYSSALMALRQRALRAIEGQNFDHLPKRFFVGRDDRVSRVRQMAGEDLLFEHLQMFGFEYVVFEALSPLEQIAIMANAEVMMSYHGAGFTNMLFASPQAYVIELGTLQTAQYRWGDFWPLAHAAQCRYVTFFCDFNSESPLLEPDFKKDGIVPVFMSDKAVAQVMAFVVTILGHQPELKSPVHVAELLGALTQVGETDKAGEVLEGHKHLLPGNVDLCLQAADYYKKQDMPKQELVALDLAVKAAPERWQTLVRIIWCAQRVERPQVIRWALARLKVDFPDRHAAFIGNHEWVRFVA